MLTNFENRVFEINLFPPSVASSIFVTISPYMAAQASKLLRPASSSTDSWRYCWRLNISAIVLVIGVPVAKVVPARLLIRSR